MPPFFSLTRLTFFHFCHLSPPWRPEQGGFLSVCKAAQTFCAVPQNLLCPLCACRNYARANDEWISVKMCVCTRERERVQGDFYVHKADTIKSRESHGFLCRKKSKALLFFSVFAFACVSVRVSPWCLSAQIYCSFSSKSDHTGVSTGSALGK